MATNIEKATYVLNNVNYGQYPAETAARLLASYEYDLAVLNRTDYPLDDATVITQAWMFAGGGTNANPSVFTIGTGLTVSINTSGVVTILATDPASTVITVPLSTTRGGVRRFLAANGVAFTA